MGDTPLHTLPKIRTYASDLARAQAKTGAELPSDVTVPKATTTPVSPPPHAEKPDSDAFNVTAAISSHIPAFHELQKKTGGTIEHTAAPSVKKGPTITVGESAPKAPTAKPVTVRAKKRESATDAKVVSGGTIITDTKKGDFKFLPSLFASIDRAFTSFIKIFKRKAAPTYSVTATERRKGVIQKATSKTGAIFTADNDTLKEEIRKRRANPVFAPQTRDGKTELSWSANTETGYHLLDGEQRSIPPVTQNVNLEFKKRAGVTVVPPPVIVEPTVPQPLPEIVPEAPLPPPPAPVYVEPAPAPVPDPEPTTPIEPVTPKTIELPEPQIETRPPLPTPTLVSEPLYSWREVRSLGDIRRLETNALVVATVGFVMIIGALVVAAIGIVNILQPHENTDPVITVPPAVSQNATTQDVLLAPLSLDRLQQEVRIDRPHQSLVHEIRFVDSNNQVIAAEAVVALFAQTVNPNFRQSVTSFSVAQIGTKRALLFKVSNKSVVLGSLLAWEPTLAAEVSPLLGIAPPSAARFVDQTYKNRDLRVVRVDDTPVLLYGFIDDTTVVITTDTDTLETLLGTP